MRQEAIYNIRLLLIAEYLEDLKKEPKAQIQEVFLEWPLHYLHVFYDIKYNVKLFDCLLKLFSDHWYFNEEFNEPQLKSFPEHGLSWAFIFFFGLKNPEEFIHLFDCQGKNQNIGRWGGTYIISTSTAFDIAFNIREYVARKL